MVQSNFVPSHIEVSGGNVCVRACVCAVREAGEGGGEGASFYAERQILFFFLLLD